MSFLRNVFASFVVILLIVVAGSIAYGYFALFRTLFGSNEALALFATFLIGVLVFFAVLSAGVELSKLRSRSRAEHGPIRFVVFYVVLFLLSAMGIIRFEMFYFEGPEIARDLTSASVGDFQEFSSSETTIFDTSEWDAFERTARAEFQQLLNDMQSKVDGYCGVGPVVRPKIDALHQKLPGFSFISGSDSSEVHSCKNKSLIDTVTRQYEQDFDVALENSTVKIRNRVTEKLQTRAQADSIVKQNLDQLALLQRLLETITTFLFSETVYDKSLVTLQRSSTDYSFLLKLAAPFYDLERLNLPRPESIETLRNLRSPVDVYKSILDRFANIRVLAFLILALGTDLALVVLVSLGREAMSKLRTKHVVEGFGKTLPNTDVAFLWSSPSSDNKRAGR